MKFAFEFELPGDLIVVSGEMLWNQLIHKKHSSRRFIKTHNCIFMCLDYGIFSSVEYFLDEIEQSHMKIIIPLDQ